MRKNFINISELIVKEALIKSGTHLACIFFVISHKYRLMGVSPPALNLYNLTKNLLRNLRTRFNQCFLKNRFLYSDKKNPDISPGQIFEKCYFIEK